MEKEINMDITKMYIQDKEKVKINQITKDAILISIIEVSVESFDAAKKVFQWHRKDAESKEI